MGLLGGPPPRGVGVQGGWPETVKKHHFSSENGYFSKFSALRAGAGETLFPAGPQGGEGGWPKRLLAGKIGLAGWTPLPPGGGGPVSLRKALPPIHKINAPPKEQTG